MAPKANTEEQLFRQFRRSRVPLWLESFWQNHGSLVTLAVIVVTSVTCGWAALTYLPRTTGQEVASAESWRQRIDNAEPKELRFVFQSLFQVQNDQVIELGLSYMLSTDEPTRLAASMALEDSVSAWRQWQPGPGSAQVLRVAKALARQSRMYNSPEQAVVVNVARQFLLWPTADDQTSHTDLILACETIFKDSRLAFLSRPEKRREDVAGIADEDLDQQVALQPWQPRPMLPSETGVADTRSRRVPVMDASFSSGASNRFTVDATRGQLDSVKKPDSVSQPESMVSQVPLVDQQGQWLGVRTIDASTLTLPGGLIPVPVIEEKMADMGYDPVPVQNRMGQQSVAEVLADRNREMNPLTPGSLTSSGRVPAINIAHPMEPGRLDATIVDDAKGSDQVLGQQNSARPLRETMDRYSQGDVSGGPGMGVMDGGQMQETPLSAIPGREEPQWQPPTQPLKRWSNIDLMRGLHVADVAAADRAEQELLRRGFSPAYISVAYRLTSSDPLERYDLVFDLPRMSAIEPLPFLKYLSNDRHPEVRDAALEQLVSLQGIDRK